jgi:hypothetical protein
MKPRRHRRGRGRGWPAALVLAALAAMGALGGFAGCRKKLTKEQCDQMLDRYAELVVKERYTDAGPDSAAEWTHERTEALRSDEFKNCLTEVQESERVCAMKAPTSSALVKCLE